MEQLKFFVVLIMICGVAGDLQTIYATDLEIQEVIKEMISKDVHRPQIQVDWQDKTGHDDSSDHASKHLFPANFNSTVPCSQTVGDALRLYKLYVPNVNMPDIIPSENKTKRNLIDQFMDGVIDSPVFAALQQFINKKVPMSIDELKKELYLLWFQPFSRSQHDQSILSSSSFEHVFLGETRGSEVIGLHNWYRLMFLENQGDLDYKGYMNKVGDVFGEIKFTWQTRWKRDGSYLFSSSIEFDFALFTFCFLTRPGSHCYFEIDDASLSLQTFKLDKDGHTFIGSAYPQLHKSSSAGSSNRNHRLH